MSTTNVVFDIHTRIVKALDQENPTCSVFSDFGQAFDTVDCHISDLSLKKTPHVWLPQAKITFYCYGM